MPTQTVPHKTAKQIMTADPVSVEVTTDARELARILADNNISGVPVLDVQDRVIGVVSKTDLLQWCVTGGFGQERDDLLARLAPRRDRDPDSSVDLGSVEDFMSTEPVIATPNESALSLARRMVKERVHRIIIVDEDGCVAGIVTSLDLLKALSA